MNPITAAAVSCTLLRSPLSSPLAPRKSSWSSPTIGKNALSVPTKDGGRRGSHDKRDMFAYPDHKEKKTDKSHTNKKKKLKFETTENKQRKHPAEKQDHKEKRLKDVAKDVHRKQRKENSKNKNCVVM